MKKIVLAAVALAVATPAFAQVATVSTTTTPVVAARGQMIVDAAGNRLAVVNRLDRNGSPQIILEGRVITVPAATLTAAGSRLQTNLTRSALLAQR